MSARLPHTQGAFALIERLGAVPILMTEPAKQVRASNAGGLKRWALGLMTELSISAKMSTSARAQNTHLA